MAKGEELGGKVVMGSTLAVSRWCGVDGAAVRDYVQGAG